MLMHSFAKPLVEAELAQQSLRYTRVMAQSTRLGRYDFKLSR